MLIFLEAKTKLWSWSGVFTLEKCEVKIGSFSNHTSYQHILHKRACRSYETVLGKGFRWQMEAPSLRMGSKKTDLLPLILRKYFGKFYSTLSYSWLKSFFAVHSKMLVLETLMFPQLLLFSTLAHPKQAASTEKREVQKENKRSIKKL